jgi:hypothetical protein
MYLRYGNYSHQAGECSISISRRSLLSEQKIMYGYIESWQIMGRLQAADVAGITAAIQALSQAYYIPNQDMGLYNDDGTPTDHILSSATANGGVIVANPPAFPEGRNAEYSTFRNYTITVEAEYPYVGMGRLLSWAETLSFQGTCGPLWGFLATINGDPERQLFRQQTSMHATQSGHASGLDVYPMPAGPIWPDLEHQDQRSIVMEIPPERSRRRTVTWNYVFESSFPLSGMPTGSVIN